MQSVFNYLHRKSAHAKKKVTLNELSCKLSTSRWETKEKRKRKTKNPPNYCLKSSIKNT